MSTSHFNIRLPMLVLTFIPWVLWTLAPVAWITNWPSGYGFVSFVALLFAGGFFAKKAVNWLYLFARGFLPRDFVAQPAENFLLFELEYLATAEKLKLFGDEIGCIFPETNHFRIRTSKRDIHILPANFEMSMYRSKGKVAGVFVRWTERGTGELFEGVAHFKYFGADARIAAYPDLKADWAQSLIRKWLKAAEPTHSVEPIPFR